MEITHIAHSYFEIKTNDLTILIDPCDERCCKKVPLLACDVLLLTHDHADHANTAAVSGQKHTITGPGEYEISNVSVIGYKSYHDDKKGEERGKNTIYLIEADGYTVMHLGDLGHELSGDVLDKLPNVDVLLIPVGGTYTINAEQASKVVASIEPGIVVPMHYQTPDLKLSNELDGVEKFLNEMGVDNPTKEKKLKVKKSDIPEDTMVVVLEPTA